MNWRAPLKVWYRNFLVWKRFYWTSCVEAIGEPILYLVAIGYGLGAVIGSLDGRPYIEFLVPALIANAIMFGTSLETTYGSYSRLKIERTFQSIVVTPISLEEVIAGEVIWGATRGLISGSILFVIVWTLGLVNSWMALAAIPVFVLEGVFFGCLGMLMTAYARDQCVFVIYLTLVLETMFLFSGTFFPLSLLPDWAGYLAWALPLTSFVAAARGLFDGAPSIGVVYGLAAVSVATPLVLWWATSKILRRLIV